MWLFDFVRKKSLHRVVRNLSLHNIDIDAYFELRIDLFSYFKGKLIFVK